MGVEIAYELPNGQLQAIVVDATVQEQHESSAEVTVHPIERSANVSGKNVSDNMSANLDAVTLQVVVSNQPIRQPKTQTDGATASQRGLEILDPTTGLLLAKANVLAFDQEFDRVQTVYDELRRLMNTATIVEIFTSLREYSSMVIRRVSPVRTAVTGDALVATVEASEIVIVDSEVIEVPEPEETRGGTGRNRGQQNNSDADEESSERNESMAAGILRAATSWSSGEDVPPPP